MKVGIIGLGVVGSAVRHGLMRIGHDVRGYDIKDSSTKFEDVLAGEIIFISVPTPQAADGTCDTSIVEGVVAQLEEARYKGLVSIKSTVEPGTTDRLQKQHSSLRLSFCPEFLRERAPYVDFVEYNDICIMGVYRDSDGELLKEVHGSLPKNFAQMKPLEAEFAKYFVNTFNALRITFANQFYDVCKAAGADYQKVKNAVVKHRVVPDVYLECNENFRGFGGKCLPKDSSAFAIFARKMIPNADLSIFEGVVEINKRYKTTVF